MLLTTVIIVNILILLIVIITAEESHNGLAMCMYNDAQEKSNNFIKL